MAHIKYKILIVLFFISFIISLVLSLIPTPEICSVQLGCSVVQSSSYNSLVGIKNSFFGIFIFAVMSFLAYLQIKYHLGYRRKIINYAVIIGALVSLFFIYIQAFVLHAYCRYCLVVDISMVIALVLTIVWWKE